ncbi:MAG: hypothetical protein JWO36_1258, partial [Myxococcales bacterium]|nr:hypothetical protein [Myxococcales bacterium]
NLGYRGDHGPATEAVLYIPMDSVVSPDGELWFLDFNNYVVRAIDANGDIRTVIGNGQLGDSPASDHLPSVPALAAFNNHTPNLFFSNGYLYLAAWHESRIKRVQLSDMTMENFAGRGVRTLYDGDGGPALKAALDLPSSITLDPAGHIVIMDQANQVVRMVDDSGNLQTIAGKCVVDLDSPCAPGVQPLACPGSNKLACIGSGPGPNVKKPLTFRERLAQECAKPCTPSYGGDDGPALNARMAQPYGQSADPAGRIAYDHAGNLLIADTENSRIRKVSNGVITTIAGTGVGGYSGDGGPAHEAQINHPIDIDIAPDNTIYFSDVDNDCIRKISPAGIISTVVGQCNPDPNARGFSGDGGPPLQAKLNRPYGINLAGNKLYVSDSYNNRIRVVNLP